MKLKPVALIVASGVIAATAAWHAVHGGESRTIVVRPEDRSCHEDADCRLVEVPCTCGQTTVAVRADRLHRYQRDVVCTSAEVSRCAVAGASVPQAAVCRVGQCTTVTAVPTSRP